MKMKKKERILREIRRRAFIRADQSSREEENRQDTLDTIDALQELTGLSRLELETIAKEVKASFEPQTSEFFSIKSQFLMVGSGLILSFISAWAFIRLIY
jgi:hypothetical protein